jgi:hypothetical protein
MKYKKMALHLPNRPLPLRSCHHNTEGFLYDIVFIDTIEKSTLRPFINRKYMKDISQSYQALLIKELDSLEGERKKQYEQLFSELVTKGMVRADIHIEQALELEMKFMRRFIEHEISQLQRLMNSSEADMNTLEKAYLYGINLLFGKSLQRMLGIINNVRSSITDDYAQEALEKVRSEALQALEVAKAEKVKET